MGEKRQIIYVVPYPGKMPYMIGFMLGFVPMLFIDLVTYLVFEVFTGTSNMASVLVPQLFPRQFANRLLEYQVWVMPASCLLTLLLPVGGIFIIGPIIKGLWDWFYE